MAIALALTAMLFWGVGDFLIQKSTRVFGDIKTLFYITVIGAVLLAPFACTHLNNLSKPGSLFIILLTEGVIFLTSLVNLEALRRGKISVIEPIYSCELIITMGLGAFVIKEMPTPLQFILILLVVCGIVLVSTNSSQKLKKNTMEKGVWLGLVAMVGLGTTNFLSGYGARQTDPVFIVWFCSLLTAVITFFYLLTRMPLKEIFHLDKKERKLALWLGITDNIAWVAYAFSSTFIPIAVAAGISESYIIIALMLGLIFNKEKLKKHQWLGLILALISVVVLAVVTDK